MEQEQVISAADARRGVAAYKHEASGAWEWAQVAHDVAPTHVGRETLEQRLQDLRRAVAEDGGIELALLPSIPVLVQRREAAICVPEDQREGVSINAASELYRLESDARKRRTTVQRLRAQHPRGRLTVDAVRAEYGRRTTRTSGSPWERARSEFERMSPAERTEVLIETKGLVDELVRDPEGSKAVTNALLRHGAEESARRSLERPAFGESPLAGAAQPPSPWQALWSGLASLALVMDRMSDEAWRQLPPQQVEKIRDDAARFSEFLAALSAAANDRLPTAAATTKEE
jgi:hypothetical protein